MFRPILRRSIPALALSLATLAGCHKAPAPAAPETQAAAVAPAPKRGVAIVNPRVVLPAVAGNPGAAYFDLSNDTDQTIVLTKVTIQGADRTEMHETQGSSMTQLPKLEVPPGGRVKFVPGGRHVMVFGLSPEAKAGQTRTMTFEFDGRPSEKATARVEAPGAEAMASMAQTGAMH